MLLTTNRELGDFLAKGEIWVEESFNCVQINKGGLVKQAEGRVKGSEFWIAPEFCQ